MTTHKLTGPPLAELVVPVEPQPKLVNGLTLHWEWFTANGVRVPWGLKWNPTGKMSPHCPYQPGDVVEFVAICSVCDEVARLSVRDRPICERCSTDDYLVQASKVVYLKPSVRTVSRVEVRQGERLEWVVFTEGKE